MEKLDVAKRLMFKELNLILNFSRNRTINQYNVYLAQAFGLDLGFKFDYVATPNLKRPYSYELREYLDNLTNFDINQEYDINLSKEVKQRCSLINNFKEDMPKDFTESRWYELLAAIMYIFKNWNDQECEFEEELKKYSLTYDLDQIIKALQTLNNKKRKQFI